jgi:hypothetical protein
VAVTPSAIASGWVPASHNEGVSAPVAVTPAIASGWVPASHNEGVSAPVAVTPSAIASGWVPASHNEGVSAPVAVTPSAIASGWVPASDIGHLDEEESAPLKSAPVIGKTVKSVDVQDIARNWEHASDAHHSLLPGPSGNVVAASWDCASISDDENDLYVPVGEPAPTSAPMNQQISNYERLMDLDSENEYSG